MNPIIYGRSPAYVANPDKLLAAGDAIEAGDGSEYIKFVKKYHKAHPELSWKQAMKKASKSYHKLAGGTDIASGVTAGKITRKKKASAGVKPFTTLIGGIAENKNDIIPYIKDAYIPQSVIVDVVKSKSGASASGVAAGNILGDIGNVIGNIFGLGQEDLSAGTRAGKSTRKKKASDGELTAGNILGDIGNAIGNIFGFGAGSAEMQRVAMMDPRMMSPELIVAAMDHAVYDKAVKGGVLSAGEEKYALKKLAELKAIARRYQ